MAVALLPFGMLNPSRHTVNDAAAAVVVVVVVVLLLLLLLLSRK
jgi:hypothetical protein